MKKKLSITEEKSINILESLVKQGNFRNKSQLIEFAIDKFGE